MNFDSLRSYLLAKPGAVEEFPFDTITLVVKVGGKMFALISTNEDPLRMNLKCDPAKAETLREIYPAILPGYHMNKRHWNSLILDGSIPAAEIRSMIDDSYALVVQGLPRPGARVDCPLFAPSMLLLIDLLYSFSLAHVTFDFQFTDFTLA